MRTTIKNVTDLAQSLDLRVDRPAETYVNIRASEGNNVLYTATSTQEAWAWLQGFKAVIDRYPRKAEKPGMPAVVDKFHECPSCDELHDSNDALFGCHTCPDVICISCEHTHVHHQP